MKQRYIIAIDPDSVKSGIAVLDVCEKTIKMHGSLSFADVCKLLQVYKYRPCTIVIEGGWINKSNWHTQGCKTFVQAAAIGRNVGMNHQTGILLSEMAKSYEMDVRIVKPLIKRWKGRDGKITHEELSKFVEVGARTNQDERDAVLLAWVYAGLPIRI